MSSMKTDDFILEAAGTGRTFGRKFGINVVFSGESAGTNGNTIVLPSLPSGKTLTKEQVAVARGYVDHESGHIRHTEIGVMDDLIEECKKSGNKMLPKILNAVEDMRMESKVIDEYPGAVRNLDAVGHAVNGEFLENYAEDTEITSNRQRIMSVALTWAGRKLLGYASSSSQACLDAIPKRLAKEAEAWVKSIKTLKDTRQALALARLIDADVREKADDEGEEILDGEPYGDEEGTPTGGSGGRLRPNVGRESPGRRKLEADEAMEVDPTFAIQKSWSDMLHTGDGSTYVPLTDAFDKVHTQYDATTKYGGSRRNNLGQRLKNGDIKVYEDRRNGMTGKINTMRRKLERAIMAKMERDWTTGKTEGVLDSRRLVAAYNGSPNVWKDRDDGEEFSTAVTVLIDLSGSMSGYPADLAMNVGIALAECFESTPVAYEILGFNNRTSEYGVLKGESGLSGRVHDGYSRYEPLDIYVFKDFDGRLHEYRPSMSSINSMVGGNNTDGESLLKAYGRLAKRTEDRKIMLVLSDGYPAFWSDFGSKHIYQHLRDVIAFITKKGVDLIGIGIDSDAVQQFYPKWQVINDLDDLPKATLDELAKMLIGSNFHVDNSDLMRVSNNRIRVGV